MSTFIKKLVMLGLFLVSATFLWSAVSMTFAYSVVNILLGILGLFFLFRALEYVDKINNLGPYVKKEEQQKNIPSEHEDNASASADETADGDVSEG